MDYFLFFSIICFIIDIIIFFVRDWQLTSFSVWGIMFSESLTPNRGATNYNQV